MLAGSLSNEQRFKPPWYRHMFSCYYARNHAQGLYMKTRSRRLCGTRSPGWLQMLVMSETDRESEALC